MQTIRLTYDQIDHLIKKEKLILMHYMVHGKNCSLYPFGSIQEHKKIQKMIFTLPFNPHMNKIGEDNNCIL